MSHHLDKSGYSHNDIRYKLEKLEEDLKKIHYIKRLTSNYEKEKVHEYKKQLDKYKNDLKGFNYWAFLLGLSAYHTTVIWTTKVLLNEMTWSSARLHLAKSVGIGIVSGFFIGYILSYDIKSYRKFMKVKKMIN